MNRRFLDDLINMTTKEQVETDENKLYDASADRYKKYAKAKLKLDVPNPIAIVYPYSREEVSDILQYCNTNQINVIPRSGKTSTEGGLENWKENTVIVDGSKMDNIIKIDTYNMEATVQSGVVLETLEKKLREKGYTTGHSPQSKPVAQMGGLVATRSIGQFSTLYGGIEDMVAGLQCVFPDGHISTIKNVPRRAGGPDIRHIAIGNEGTLCYITEVTVKIFKYYPENNTFHGYLLENMDEGIKMLREVMVNGFKPSVARLYSEEDAEQHFSHFYKGMCVLIFMSEGPAGIVDATNKAITEAVQKYRTPGTEEIDSKLIETWFYQLNWTQDKLDEEETLMLKQDKHDGFTTEISANWEDVIQIYYNVMERIKTDFERYNDLTMLGGHSSHSYINGTNLYFVYNYHINCTPEEELNEYHHPIHAIIIEETLKLGGSMCHHHGIGKYRAEWTTQEHDTAYYMLQKLKEAYDPNEIMNFGSIFPQKNEIDTFIKN